MRLIMCCLVLLVALACSKSRTFESETAIIGSWHPEGTPDGRILTFTEEGHIIYSQWDAIRPYTFSRYRVEGSGILVLSGANTQQQRRVHFNIVGNLLTLEGACVESCSERLFRIGEY